MRINRWLVVFIVCVILFIGVAGVMIYQDGVRGAINVFSGGTMGLLFLQQARQRNVIIRLHARLAALAPYEDAMNGISVQQQRVHHSARRFGRVFWVPLLPNTPYARRGKSAQRYGSP